LKIISIDKPKGWTSFDVVHFLKQKFHEKKVGHLGTLDPNATGVLPVFLGKATRLIPLFNNIDKTYRAVCKLGVSTNTYDTEGEITNTRDAMHLESEKISEALYSFIGDKKQTVPPFSASKINGVPFYKLARNGKTVPNISKKVSFFEIEVEDIELPFVRFLVRCSKGTYIRSMANDLGILLKVGAHLNKLERLACGKLFNCKNSISVKKLKDIKSDGEIPWISPLNVLSHIYTIYADEKMLSFIKFGRQVKISQSNKFFELNKSKFEYDFIDESNHIQTKVLDDEQNLVAIGFLLWENNHCYFQPSKVFI